MTKTVILCRIDMDTNKVIDAYFDLISDEGKRLHSIQIAPTDDPAERLAALRSCSVKGFGPINVTDEEWALVAAECAAQHTPEVKATFEAYMAEERANARALA